MRPDLTGGLAAEHVLDLRRSADAYHLARLARRCCPPVLRRGADAVRRAWSDWVDAGGLRPLRTHCCGA
jgi:hypothetical protein